MLAGHVVEEQCLFYRKICLPAGRLFIELVVESLCFVSGKVYYVPEYLFICSVI